MQWRKFTRLKTATGHSRARRMLCCGRRKVSSNRISECKRILPKKKEETTGCFGEDCFVGIKVEQPVPIGAKGVLFITELQ